MQRLKFQGNLSNMHEKDLQRKRIHNEEFIYIDAN